MDHKFTEQIKVWLETPADQRDYSVGALYLLKLSGNQILYKNIVAALDKRHDVIEYQLQKYYNFRVQALTHAQVEEMAAQVETIVAEHIPLAATADEQPQKGKRADHDSLPDEIKSKYVENLSLLQRMRELHLRLRSLSLENATCPDSERYPFLKELIGKHSFNHSIMILSDMPQTQKGSWFLHYRDKMDAELIRTIEATVYEIWRTKERIRALNAKGAQVPPYLKGYLRRLDRDLNKMRSVAVYYREYSSIENLQLLGENYIKQMKRDLTPLTFQTSILCQRIGIAKDGFYSSMREGHKYDANDNQYLDTLGYDYDFSMLDARADKDVDPDAPICIGMDYNANINWIVAGQPRDRRLNVIKSFYVKFERKIPALVEDFCRYYAEHRNKTVVYYYDATALGSNYAVNEQDYRWWVVHEFERRGWQVEAVYLGNPMRQDEKHLLINQGFAGKQRLVPFFNRSNNEDLILAIQSAGVSRGRNGFRKDKSGEKLAESEEDLLEHRTDGTDAFDTLYIGCEKFPYHDSFSLSASGVL